MYRKSIYEKVGEYNKNLFCAEDYDYWCRIALNGTIHYSKEILYKYRVNSQSLTATKKAFVREQAEKVREKYLKSFLDKYKVSYNFKVKCFLKLWKFENNKKYLLKAILMNPFISIIKLLKNKF